MHAHRVPANVGSLGQSLVWWMPVSKQMTWLGWFPTDHLWFLAPVLQVHHRSEEMSVENERVHQLLHFESPSAIVQ